MNRLLVFATVALILACQSPAPPIMSPTEIPTPMLTPEFPAQPLPLTLAFRLVLETGQWKVGRTDFPEGSPQSHALTVGSEQVRVTCIHYKHKPPVPRVNIPIAGEVHHKLVQNQDGDWQGEVDAQTTVGGRVVEVEWLTWVTRADRLRLRGRDARVLIRVVRESSAPSFRLEVSNNSFLSRDYDVTGLGAAISEAGLTCFE